MRTPAPVRGALDFRLILHKRGDTTVLCYVDHHHAAYAWAGRRRLDVHESTGAAQMAVIDERTEEVVKRVPRVIVDDDVSAPERPSARLDDAALLAYGVPRPWLRRVRDATLDAFLDDIGDALPNEAQEYLLRVADGETPEVPVRSHDPFTHPDARRRFYLLDEDDQALRNALAAPWATRPGRSAEVARIWPFSTCSTLMRIANLWSMA